MATATVCESESKLGEKTGQEQIHKKIHLGVAVHADTFDNKNMRLVIRTNSATSPIRVYNMDDWSLHDEFGGNIRKVCGPNAKEYLDLTTDTKRNVYVINIPESSTGNLVRIHENGNVGKTLSLGEKRWILSVDYGAKDDVYACLVKEEHYKIRVIKPDTFTSVADTWVGDITYSHHTPTHACKVRIGTMEQKTTIVLMNSNTIQLFDIGTCPLRTYSLYTSAEGKLVELNNPTGLSVDNKGRIIVVGERVVGFWNDTKKVHRKELRLDDNVAFTERTRPVAVAISNTLDKVCVFFSDHLLAVPMNSIVF